MPLQKSNPDIVPLVGILADLSEPVRNLSAQSATNGNFFISALGDADFTRYSARPGHTPFVNTDFRPQGGNSRAESGLYPSDIPVEFCRRVAVDLSDSHGFGSTIVTCCCGNTNDALNQEQRHLDSSEQRADLRSSSFVSPAAGGLDPDLQSMPVNFLEGLEDIDFDDDIGLFCDCGPGCSCVGCMIHQNRANSIGSAEEEAKLCTDYPTL